MSGDGRVRDDSRSSDADSDSEEPPEDVEAADDPDDSSTAIPDQATRAELLAAENRRLREEYDRAVRSQYRNTALALGAVGVVAALGGVLFPTTRELLFAVAGTGLFLAALTYYLAPERMIPASLGRSGYEAHARTGSDLVAELGLRDDRVYVSVEQHGVRLFVPQHEEYAVPDPDALSRAFVAGDDPATRGVAFDPTGGALFEEFERAATDELDPDPATLAERLTDALVDPFELVAVAEPELDPAGGRVTVGVTDARMGGVDRFDHPVQSFLGVGFATALDRPVRVAVESGTDEYDALATCTWSESDGEN